MTDNLEAIETVETSIPLVSEEDTMSESADPSTEAQGAMSEEDEASVEKDPIDLIPVTEPIQVETQEQLQEVLKAHSFWMEGVLNPKVKIPQGRANLHGADLRKFDLTGVNLSGADLSEANLQGVELSGANLTVANLSGALLQAANLRGAKLTKAKVEGADFTGADLTDAILRGVEIPVKAAKSLESEDNEPTDQDESSEMTDVSEGTRSELAAEADPDLDDQAQEWDSPMTAADGAEDEFDSSDLDDSAPVEPTQLH